MKQPPLLALRDVKQLAPVTGTGWLAVVAVLGLALAAAGCSGTSQLDTADAGRTFSYVPGAPNFDLEAVASWRSQASGIDIYVSVPYRSLAYLQQGDGFVARFDMITQLRDASGEGIISEEYESLTRRVATYDSTQLFTPFILARRIPAGSGTYVAQVMIQDKNGGATAVRAQQVELVDWSSEEPALSRIRLEARDEGRPFEPVLAPHLPDRLDSLRAVIEYYNAPERVDLTMTLLQPQTDAKPAEPPYWYQLRDQRYTYEGLDYRRSDTLQVTRRTLRNVGREVTVVFTLPALDEGAYRIEVSATAEEGSEPQIERRDFTVKGKNFPQITTLDEMVDALVYIARDRELRTIREAETLEEKRAAFEAFWLRLASTPREAADLIKQYYSRVEEANLLFTSHKRGWKTDQGMVFIIMGPPNYVDRRYGDGRRLFIWRYPPPKQSSAPLGYYPVDPQRSPVSQMETRFVFEEVRKLDRDIPYPQYILRRDRVYQRMWEDAVSLWRSGRVL